MYTYLSEDGSLMVAGETLIMYSGNEEHVVIPKEIEPGHPIRVIGNAAFHACRLMKTVTLPDSVTSIGKEAFKDCTALTGITFPNSVTSIGRLAFWGCTALKEITLPDSVTSIGDNAFDDCKALTEITLPDSVTSIGRSAFGDCGMTNKVRVSFPEAEFTVLLQNSRLNSAGERLVLRAKSSAFLAQMAKNNSHYPVLDIPGDIPCLFADRQNPNGAFRRSVYEAYNSNEMLCFWKESGTMTEDKAFRRLTANHERFGTENADAETQCDWYLRAEKAPSFRETCCITFREDQVVHENGKVRVPISFKKGWWFWQSSHPVSWNGKKYRIYSRNYLTGDEKVPYYRLDMAVYDSKGLVTDRELSRKIYAKYKLASIL